MTITTRHLYEALLYNLENIADEYKHICYMVDGKTVDLLSGEVKEELERRLKKIKKDNEIDRHCSKMRHDEHLKKIAPCLLDILAGAPEEGLSAEEIQTIFLNKYPDNYSIEIERYEYNMTVARINSMLKKDLSDKVIAFFNNNRKRVYRLRKEEA